MVFRLLFVVPLISTRSDCLCYLEDVSSTCSLCWKTKEPFGKRAPTLELCPVGAVDTEWIRSPPQDMREGMPYQVQYRLNINASILPPVPVRQGDNRQEDNLWQVPHSNIHSCLKHLGLCTPFVNDSPGLSTHTPAKAANLTFTSEGMYSMSFDHTFQLPAGEYTIIAHSRFFIADVQQSIEQSCFPACLIKYDIAIGVGRKVANTPTQLSVPLDAYITAAIVAGGMLLSAGSVIWAVSKGSISINRCLIALFRDEVRHSWEIIMILGETSAFTAAVFQEVFQDEKLNYLIPIATFFMFAAWVASIYCAAQQFMILVELWKRRFRHENFLKASSHGISHDIRNSATMQSTNRNGSNGPLCLAQSRVYNTSHGRPPLQKGSSFHSSGSNSSLASTSTVRSIHIARSEVSAVARRISIEEASAVAGSSFSGELIFALLDNDDNGAMLLEDYVACKRQLSQRYMDILTMLFADLPITLIDAYILLASNSPEVIVVIALCLSSMFLGSKLTGLLGSSREAAQLRETRSQIADFVRERTSINSSEFSVMAI